MSETSLYADLLAVMTADRRAHSVAVGMKVAGAADRVPAWMRGDLVAAGFLHDVGYCHEARGFHPLDGAGFLADQGSRRLSVILLPTIRPARLRPRSGVST